MLPFSEDIERRASQYASGRGMRILDRLGFGRDGSVYSTSASTALKIHGRPESYARERDCYLRLREHEVVDVRGFHVPQLIAWDDGLLAIEMTVVERPFLLDFAATCLDEAPDFTEEVMQEWHDEKREQFGEHWDEVRLVLAVLRGHYGIHLLDVNPRNITFS
jgi:hypothetical protein